MIKYKLKIKAFNCVCETTKEYKTLQEVADKIKEVCNADNLKDILKAQKEYNIRFYISSYQSKYED